MSDLADLAAQVVDGDSVAVRLARRLGLGRRDPQSIDPERPETETIVPERPEPTFEEVWAGLGEHHKFLFGPLFLHQIMEVLNGASELAALQRARGDRPPTDWKDPEEVKFHRDRAGRARELLAVHSNSEADLVLDRWGFRNPRMAAGMARFVADPEAELADAINWLSIRGLNEVDGVNGVTAGE